MTEDDLYRRLQRHLDRMPVPFPATESGIEIRLLKRLFTPDDARVALAISMLPERADTIGKRLRGEMEAAQVQQALNSMADRGLINRLPGKDGPRYCKAPIVVGFYESQVNRLTEELERDFLQYMDDGLARAMSAQPTLQMRTVPINRPIAVPESPVASYDDMRELVRTHKGPFAAMNCICQQGHDLLSKPCRVTDNREHCLTLGVAARMIAASGKGREITREEMLGFLDRADREGLVLQPQNTQDPLFVCTCCGCCCGIISTAKKFPRPLDFFNANYHVDVKAADCQACGTCVGRCQMEALSADDGPATVDLTRCIGCGLCVTTCPSGALRLVPNEQSNVPPGDTMKLYAQMYRERFGALKLAAAFGRSLIGLKT